MNIAPQRVVTLHYVLRDERGHVLDDSRARAKPLEYLHGHDNILAGLERALAGHVAGDRLSVTLPPEEAYGERNDDLVQQVGRGAFPQEGLAPGMRFQTPGDDGPQIVTVREVGDDTVVIDTNHPLAGHTLGYALEVLEVRQATRAELAKGHPLAAGVEPSQVEDRKVP
ncbi:peptidylprolyl isomerase [Halomonas sp. MCCC 1A17488]|uniref:Peptidyl-prolyl cis-trans isomerase n=1 Tax=Billgrantia sulfidoxydans TaxID=2733484 RepID=A0ABX7W4S3_9GAMM|nr:MULTISPECIES: peptidylprolyl isomerase [Halomonas]MCE8015603.1 peptidylprolyl isomerase [Halomonas sp. MCCC 1A17488]MCG3238936.1 peptidylprolyl isomerase [Halomonas sp. MCCC 1A17488]QPP51111.1 peptidylprolyl isomerase [Halomonas sp. SS10-MC5]QTP54622.1 peptidylprolyl isomerase [Halomonas sulfidoxydans]